MSKYCETCKTKTDDCIYCPNRKKPHCDLCGKNYDRRKKVVKKAPKKYTAEAVNKAYDAGWDAACKRIMSLVDDEKK